MSIIVVGLGNSVGDMTLRAQSIIEKASKLVIRTKLTNTYKYFIEQHIEVESFDDLYESADDFSGLDDAIIARLAELENEYGDVVYMVDGSGYEDTSVVKLMENREDITIVGGVGSTHALLAKSPATSYATYSACDILNSAVFAPDKRISVYIKDIFSAVVASELKLILARKYGEECDVLYTFAGRMTKIKLFMLDRQHDYDYSSALLIAPEKLETKHTYDFADLLEIMYTLRGEDGCPWDKAQTHESIRINLIEEAYELVDAIDNDDIFGMIEETGDVLLQAVFHAIIGEQTGEYDIDEALTSLCQKLITRHTHIFGENKANNGEEALGFWEQAKAVEKGYTGYSDKLDKIARSLPSLLYAYKVQKTAHKAGMIIPFEDAIASVENELKELVEADDSDKTMEAGDLLFSVINVLRMYGIEPELALKMSVDKFIARTKEVDRLVMADHKSMKEMTLAELDKYYIKAKKSL